jgi:hypothetical protein
MDGNTFYLVLVCAICICLLLMFYPVEDNTKPPRRPGGPGAA